MQKILGIVMPIGAALSLLLTLYLALVDRVQAASLTATLTVALALLSYLPHFESWKGWGVEAKWRKQLSEAEDILRNLRRLAVVAARQNFIQMAEAGRLGGNSSNADKRQLAIEFSEVLAELKVDKAIITESRKPLVAYAGLDLLLALHRITAVRAQRARQSLISQRDALFGGGPVNVNDPRYQEWLDLHKRIQELDVGDAYLQILNDPTPERFAKICDSMAKLTDLPASDKTQLELIASELKQLFKRMNKEGLITEEVATFLDGRGKYGGSLMKEHFPDANT